MWDGDPAVGCDSKPEVTLESEEANDDGLVEVWLELLQIRVRSQKHLCVM